MKVVIHKNNLVLFETIKIGKTFKHDNNHFLKIDKENGFDFFGKKLKAFLSKDIVEFTMSKIEIDEV